MNIKINRYIIRKRTGADSKSLPILVSFGRCGTVRKGPKNLPIGTAFYFEEIMRYRLPVADKKFCRITRLNPIEGGIYMGMKTVKERRRARSEDKLGKPSDGRENEDGEESRGRVKRFLSKFKKPSKKTVVLLIIAAVVIAVAAVSIVRRMAGGGTEEIKYTTATVERRSITRTVDGSSVVEANDTYEVTALVTGEILSDNFSEGDLVTKDQLLYTIDSSDAQQEVETAQNSLVQAQQQYADAVRQKANTVQTNSLNEQSQQNAILNALASVDSAARSLNDAQEDYDNLTITANYSGTVAEVLVNNGDSVNDGTQLARVYDSSRLKIQLPFNEADADTISVGDSAVLTIASSGDTVAGTVETVGTATQATSSHAIVRYVTIVVDNPGGLTTEDSATAVVNGAACNDLGTFEYYDEGYINARSSGRIGELYLQENDVITEGQVIGYITSTTVENNLESARDQLESAERSRDDAYNQLEQLVIQNDTYSLDSNIQSAQISLDNARISLERAQENLEDYEITAPIEGTIIEKNKKAGDKLENNSSSTSEAMAVIYDMSTLKVQLSVDETDVQDIQTGQEVTITADAVEGTFTGTVEKVGVNGTSENGVTTYPVDIVITEYGDLLPGMNVDCVITVESSEDVLAVPVEAVQRGNIVYVQGEKTDESDNAPEGYYSVDVETGITDSVYIEIKSGLNEGDVVCGSISASGNEAQGSVDSSTMQMQGGMGGMGGMSGGGGMGGGMPGGGGGGAPGGGGGPM